MKKQNKDTTKNIVLTKKAKIWISIIMAVVIVISFFCGFFTYRISCGKNTNSLSWAISMIDKYGCYYDEETGEIKKYTEEDYLKMIMANLDSYSEFYTKEEYSNEIATSKGNNYGIGLSFLIDTTTKVHTVYRVLWNSPAEKAGVKEGDIFKGIYKNGEKILFNTSFTASDSINEITDTEEHTFIISRNGEDIEIKLKREIYLCNYVKYFDSEKSLTFTSSNGESLKNTITDEGLTELDNDTAYIALYLFEGNAKTGIEQAIKYLKERNKKKLILDLRKNGGGFMDVLENVSSYFLKNASDSKPIIAIAKDNDGKEEIFKATENSYLTQLENVVVLANEGTASASECLIGAMLHYGTITKETLVIEKHQDKNGNSVATTYGKGIMQTTYKNIFSGEAIKLTTAKIYWPDGETSIHGVGITTTSENEVEKDMALNRAIAILS